MSHCPHPGNLGEAASRPRGLDRGLREHPDSRRACTVGAGGLPSSCPPPPVGHLVWGNVFSHRICESVTRERVSPPTHTPTPNRENIRQWPVYLVLSRSCPDNSNVCAGFKILFTRCLYIGPVQFLALLLGAKSKS